MSSSRKLPHQPIVEFASDNPGMLVQKYCERLKVSNAIFESAKDSYDKVSVSKWYRGQIPAAIAVASIFNACRWQKNYELIPLCYKLEVPIDQVVHALWVVEASSARTNVYRPSPMVTYEPSSYNQKHTYAIADADGAVEPKTIKLSWSWPERLAFTLEGHYDTKSPHLTETYNRVSREMNVASSKASIQQSKETIQLVEEMQSFRAAKAHKELAPSKNLVATDAASRNFPIQQPKRRIPHVQEVQSLEAAKPPKNPEPPKDQIIREVQKPVTTANPTPEPNTTPTPTKPKSSKKRTATKKSRSKKQTQKNEDEEWDIIDSTDDDEKDKDWVEVSGRELMAEKNEPMGWKGSLRRWIG